ncbi:conserved hypothetical protein [Vibrio jasicida]|uniref:Polymer-forming cytoskeletal family protein n=1 Tax=Vibrio jasicida TaxID=766224 RepID=A0AAU9QTM3_9VIBR|nr:conserved hypothetical protein [Vibrio jasicida]CAH1601757.1 conserved hypothetical protein [Vibrio jasicida]
MKIAISLVTLMPALCFGKVTIDNYIDGKQTSITINGHSYKGTNIDVSDSEIRIDGKKIQLGKSIQIQIEVHGNIETLSTTSGVVIISGNVESLNTTSGNVKTKSVFGGVTSVSGSVNAGTIHGGVKTYSGQIMCE